ncbi:MAG: hypothetical protein HFG22_00765 [Lachnospiraceae bacterium]|nr:hypothetical protein [Lachnospiraceae bacterium]
MPACGAGRDQPVGQDRTVRIERSGSNGQDRTGRIGRAAVRGDGDLAGIKG